MAVVTKPLALDESFKTTESTPRGIADVLKDIADSLSGGSHASYIINCPTTGYTSSSVTIWGVTKTLYEIVIRADATSQPLSNFHSGMKEDYPINIDGSQSDFGKLYAFEIGEGQVTFYFTSAPSSAFNVLIREAV